MKGDRNRDKDATDKNIEVDKSKYKMWIVKIHKHRLTKIQVMTLIKEERQDHRDIMRVEKWEKQMHGKKNNEWLIINCIGI